MPEARVSDQRPIDRLTRGASDGRARVAPGVFSPVLLALLLALTPPYASPVDPTWISGIYDEADFDDVVGSLADTSAVADCVLRAAIAPQPFVVTQPASGSSQALPGAPVPPLPPRSPPVA